MAKDNLAVIANELHELNKILRKIERNSSNGKTILCDTKDLRRLMVCKTDDEITIEGEYDDTWKTEEL